MNIKKHTTPTLFYKSLLLFGAIGFCVALWAGPRNKKKEDRGISTTEMRRYNAFFLEGVVQREAGNNDAALELFEHALSINPDGTETMFELALLYDTWFEDHSNEIRKLLINAAASDSTNYYYQTALADMLARTDTTRKEAIVLYEQIYKRFPSYSNILPKMADLYNVTQQPEGVLRMLERMETNEGKSEDLSIEKAKIFIQMGDSTRAVDEMKELCASNPSDQDLCIALADVYLSFNQTDSALAIYRRVLQHEPDNGSALLRMLYNYRSTGNDSLYRTTLEKLVFNPSQSAQARIQAVADELARITNERTDSIKNTTRFIRKLLSVPGNESNFVEFVLNAIPGTCVPVDSIKVFRQMMIKSYPNSVAIRYTLLSDALKAGDYALLTDLCKEGIEYNPEILIFYYYGGVSLYKMDKLKESADMLVKGETKVSLDSPPELVSDYYGTLADVQRELNRKSESYAAFEKALEYKATNVMCLNNYAYYLSLDKKDLDKAEQMAEQAIKIEPQNPIYIDTYAWVLFVKGETAKAKIYIDEMLSCLKNESSDDAGLIEHAGDIYAECGLIDKAVDFWNRAVKLGSTSKTIKEKIKLKKYIDQ